MKTTIIEVADDEVLVAIKRPEGYEDVDPELVVEDFIKQPLAFEGRTVWPTDWQPPPEAASA